MIEKKLLGLDCLEFSFGEVTILVTQSVGPRILSLKFRNSDNIFAELPGQYLSYRDDKKFYFFGGHRLWIAPEIPEVTYSPDNFPVELNQDLNSISLIQKADPTTGLQKEIRIQAGKIENTLIIDHFIHNRGKKQSLIAPWAITQLNREGTAILPFDERPGNENPLLPNRTIILWPYTELCDQRISIKDGFIFIHPQAGKGPLKLGIPNVQNWLAFRYKNTMFIKFSKKLNKPLGLDLGAAGQCYCNDQFIELETLGNLETIAPGDSLRHREVWKLAEVDFPGDDEKRIRDFFISNSWMDECRDLLGA